VTDTASNVEPPLTEREEVHAKLLNSLKASGTGGELGVVRRIATWIDSPRVIALIASHPAWFDDWGVKEALIRNEHTPERFRSRCARTVGVLDLLRELDSPDLSSDEKAEVRDQARNLIRTLPTEDRERVHAQALELSSSRAATEVTEAATAEPPTDVAYDPDDTLPLTGPESTEPEPPELEPVPGPTPVLSEEDEITPERGKARALSTLPMDRKIAVARTSRDLAVLQVLSGEDSDDVRLALLANPSLGERLVADIARGASSRVAREIYRNRRLFQRPMVRRALLESPNVPSAALVEVVSSMGDLRGLLGLTQNPKIRSMEVKARARARLTALFGGLGSSEKISTIRSSGRSLLKALWADFFRDEELVLRCLRECHLDKGLVIEIARSSIAPRRALKLIGETPSLSAPYEVRLALVQNPKTPPTVVERMLHGLRPADRQALEGHPTVSQALRKSS
jgi:hypothetical protein